MEKIGVDRLSTGLSNCGSVFVFNKTFRGVGSVAEGRRQRDVGARSGLSPKSPSSRVIAVIGEAKPYR
jgi:hypothetical protein